MNKQKIIIFNNVLRGRNSYSMQIIDLDATDSLTNSTLDVKKQTKILIHGWKNDGLDFWKDTVEGNSITFVSLRVIPIYIYVASFVSVSWGYYGGDRVAIIANYSPRSFARFMPDIVPSFMCRHFSKWWNMRYKKKKMGHSFWTKENLTNSDFYQK